MSNFSQMKDILSSDKGLSQGGLVGATIGGSSKGETFSIVLSSVVVGWSQVV